MHIDRNWFLKGVLSIFLDFQCRCIDLVALRVGDSLPFMSRVLVLDDSTPFMAPDPWLPSCLGWGCCYFPAGEDLGCFFVLL